MPLKQRTVHYSFKGQQLLTVAENAFMRWAGRSKGVNIDAIGRAGELMDVGEGILAQAESFDAGAFEGKRFTHVVSNDGGTYRTEVTAVRKGNEGWIQTDVHVPREDAKFAPPAVPRFLLEAAAEKDVKFFDGSLYGAFSPAPRIQRIKDVGTLLDEVINHPDRANPAVVAGSDYSRRLDVWSATLEDRIFRSNIGLSTLWLLDPEATEEFNALVRDQYQVWPNSVHLFGPGVDTESPGNSGQHRYFSRKDLTEDPKFTSRRIYHLARSLTLRIPIPPALAEAAAHLRKASTDRIVASLEPPMPLRKRLAANTPTQQALFDLPQDRPQQLEIELQPSTSEQDIPSEKQVNAAGAENRGTSGPPEAPTDTERSGVQQPKRISVPDSVSGDSTSHPLQKVATHSEWEHEADLPKLLANLAETIGLPVNDKKIDEEFLLRLFELAEQGRQAEQTIIKLRRTREELNEIEQARNEAEEMAEELLEELDTYDANAARDRALASKMWLLLKEQGNDFEDWTDPTQEYPSSISQILRRMNEFEHIEFTGDEKKATTLDERDNALSIARNCWQFLISLEQYARQWAAGHQDVDTFLKETVSPANCTLHAPSESKDVRNTDKFNKERRFRVPPEVNFSGYEYMYAHYRLSQSTGKAARLHYFDDMANSQRMYIGYVGSHLRSRMTT